MKTLKWISLAMLVLGFCTSQVQAQCNPGISIEMSAEYQGTDTQVTYSYDGSTGCLATTVDFKVIVSLSGTACPIFDGVVDLILPDGTPVNLDTTLALNPGGSITYDVTGSPYTVDFADLGTMGAPGDNVRGLSSVAATADRGGGLTQQVNGDANFDIRVLHPRVKITKSVDRDLICEDDPDGVTYTYRVEWGDTPPDEEITDSDLEEVSVVDSDCGPLSRGLDDPGNDDGVLEEGEVWVYTCSTLLAGTTTNTVTATFVEPLLGCEVEATDEVTVTVVPAPECGIDGPIEVCSDSTNEYCADILVGGPIASYEWSVSGAAAISGDNSGDCVDVVAGASGSYVVSLIVTNEAGCVGECELQVTIIEQPDCSIDSGPRTLCDDQIDIPQEYCTLVVADNYEWVVVSGPGNIPGDNLSPCVDVVPTGVGTIVLELRVSNDVPDDGTCDNSCQIEILVEECGQTFCSFTQGFWGNAGGKSCDGQTTTQLINLALANAGGSITVGIPPRSITFDSAECILASLPAGGTPSALPAVGGPWTCADLSSFYKNKNKTEINNVLVGQAVALTLNLLVSEGCVEDSGDLADWVIPGDFCTVPYGYEEACAELTMMPESLIGKTVQEVLDAANAALAGIGSIGDAYSGAAGINEGFDECRTVVPCIRPEICGNGCDDDGDGLVDGDDPDCQPN